MEEVKETELPISDYLNYLFRPTQEASIYDYFIFKSYLNSNTILNIADMQYILDTISLKFQDYTELSFQDSSAINGIAIYFMCLRNIFIKKWDFESENNSADDTNDPKIYLYSEHWKCKHLSDAIPSIIHALLKLFSYEGTIYFGNNTTDTHDQEIQDNDGVEDSPGRSVNRTQFDHKTSCLFFLNKFLKYDQYVKNRISN